MAFDLGLVEDAYTAALSNPQHDMVEEKVRRLVLALVEQGEAHAHIYYSILSISPPSHSTFITHFRHPVTLPVTSIALPCVSTHTHVCRRMHRTLLAVQLVQTHHVTWCTRFRQLGPDCGSALTLGVHVVACRSAAAAAQPAMGGRAGAEAGKPDRASASRGGAPAAVLGLRARLHIACWGGLTGAACNTCQCVPACCRTCCDHSGPIPSAGSLS